MHRILLSAIALGTCSSPAFAAPTDAPSRKAVDGCAWEKRSDVALGLASWVQRCDFGFRKIEFLVVGTSLAVRYSDGGAAEPVIDVFDLNADETPEAGLERIFAARTDKPIAARCVLAPHHFKGSKVPDGVKRYAFVADAAYRKELAKTQDPNEVGEPACGHFGAVSDSVQYFETQPGSGVRKVLYVRVGQDEPLFDDATLKLLPADPVSN